MSKYIILGHDKPYSVENGGVTYEGVKVSMLSSRESVKPGEKGFKPIISTLSLNLLEKLKTLPAVYDVDIEMVAGKKNVMEPAIVDLAMVKPVDVVSLFK